MDDNTKYIKYDSAKSEIQICNVDKNDIWTLTTTGPILLSCNCGTGPKSGIKVFKLPILKNNQDVQMSVDIHINGSEPCHKQIGSKTQDISPCLWNIDNTNIVFTDTTTSATINLTNESNPSEYILSVSGYEFTSSYTANAIQLTFNYKNAKSYPCTASLHLDDCFYIINFSYQSHVVLPPTKDKCVFKVTPSTYSVPKTDSSVIFFVTSKRGFEKMPYDVYSSTTSNFSRKKKIRDAITDENAKIDGLNWTSNSTYYFQFSSECSSALTTVNSVKDAITTSKCSLNTSNIIPTWTTIKNNLNASGGISYASEPESPITFYTSSFSSSDTSISSITSYSIDVRSVSETMRGAMWSYDIDKSLQPYIRGSKNILGNKLVLSLTQSANNLESSITSSITIANNCGQSAEISCTIKEGLKLLEEYQDIFQFKKVHTENNNTTETVWPYTEDSAMTVAFNSVCLNHLPHEENDSQDYIYLYSKNDKNDSTWTIASKGKTFLYNTYMGKKITIGESVEYVLEPLAVNAPITASGVSLFFYEEASFYEIKNELMNQSDLVPFIAIVYPSSVTLNGSFKNTLTFKQFSTNHNLELTLEHYEERVEQQVSSITLSYKGSSAFTYGETVNLTPNNVLTYYNRSWFDVYPDNTVVPIPFRVQLSSVTFNGYCDGDIIVDLSACTLSSVSQSSEITLPWETVITTSLTTENIEMCSAECFYSVTMGTKVEDEVVYPTEGGQLAYPINGNSSLTVTFAPISDSLTCILESTSDNIYLTNGDNSDNPLYIACFEQLGSNTCRLGLNLSVEGGGKRTSVEWIPSLNAENNLITSPTTIPIDLSYEEDGVEIMYTYNLIVTPVTSLSKDIYTQFDFLSPIRDEWNNVKADESITDVQFLGYEIAFDEVSPNYTDSSRFSIINLSATTQDGTTNTMPIYAYQESSNVEYFIRWSQIALGVNNNISWDDSYHFEISLGCDASFFNVCGIYSYEVTQSRTNYLNIEYSLSPIDGYEGINFSSQFIKTKSNPVWFLLSQIEANNDVARANRLTCWVSGHPSTNFIIDVYQEANTFGDIEYELVEFTAYPSICGNYPQLKLVYKTLPNTVCGESYGSINTISYESLPQDEDAYNFFQNYVSFYAYEDCIDNGIDVLEEFTGNSRNVTAHLEWNGIMANAMFVQVSCGGCEPSIECNHVVDSYLTSNTDSVVFTPLVSWVGSDCSSNNKSSDVFISSDGTDFAYEKTLGDGESYELDNGNMPFKPTTFVKFACHENNFITTESYSVTEYTACLITAYSGVRMPTSESFINHQSSLSYRLTPDLPNAAIRITNITPNQSSQVQFSVNWTNPNPLMPSSTLLTSFTSIMTITMGHLPETGTTLVEIFPSECDNENLVTQFSLSRFQETGYIEMQSILDGGTMGYPLLLTMQGINGLNPIFQVKTNTLDLDNPSSYNHVTVNDGSNASTAQLKIQLTEGSAANVNIEIYMENILHKTLTNFTLTSSPQVIDETGFIMDTKRRIIVKW